MSDTRFKKIKDYTAEELEETINHAVATIPHFWTIMKGVDAYMEKRRRKEEAAAKKGALGAQTNAP